MKVGFWESGIEQEFDAVVELLIVGVAVVVVVRRLEKMSLLTCERALCCNKTLYEPERIKFKSRI